MRGGNPPFSTELHAQALASLIGRPNAVRVWPNTVATVESVGHKNGWRHVTARRRDGRLVEGGPRDFVIPKRPRS